MADTVSVTDNTKYTDRDLIEAIVSSFYIVDYGYINKVNADGTVNVVHAVKQVMRDGKVLDQTETQKVELLFLAGSGFSLKWDVKAGDKVLLLGLKDYVKNINAVTKAAAPDVYIHYRRSNLKALPLCIFNSDAKVKIEAAAGTLKVTSSKMELNGNSKQFVTWTELNTALQNLITLLNTHTHSNGNEGSPTGVPISPLSVDISSAKTMTVVTGG